MRGSCGSCGSYARRKNQLYGRSPPGPTTKLLVGKRISRDKIEPVEALGQHPLVVKAKEGRESKNDDDEADGDDDDHDVV